MHAGPPLRASRTARARRWRARIHRRLVFHLVPVALVVVAVYQIHLAHTAPLSPWKGGGFGMFASIDRPVYRVFRADLITDDRTYMIQLEMSNVSTALIRLQPLPREHQLEEVGRLLLEQAWQVTGTGEGGGNGTDGADGADGEAEADGAMHRPTVRPTRNRSADNPNLVTGVRGVHLHVYRLNFDAQSHEVFLTPLQSVEVGGHE